MKKQLTFDDLLWGNNPAEKNDEHTDQKDQEAQKKEKEEKK